MKNLQDLFLDELQDMYDAEHRIVKALPKLIKAATDSALQEALQSHLGETKGHITKLERVFKICGEKPQRKTCKATVGLLKEGDEIAEDFAGSPAINAAVISAGQKVEHYEIASYGSLREWAGLLSLNNAVTIIAEILGEEEAADEKLTQVARSCSNEEAMTEAEPAAKSSPKTRAAKSR